MGNACYGVRYLGGMGAEGTQVLKRLIRRAVSWHDGDQRAACQDRLQMAVGVALMTSIWGALYNKIFI